MEILAWGCIRSGIALCFLVAAAFAEIANAQAVRIVDPLAIQADGNPSQAVVALAIPQSILEQACDIVILGAGLGGSAAALSASGKAGRVCMTEPTNWIGGQMTSQGISAFDDNEWTETTGATRSFRTLRQKIREHYAPMLRTGVKAGSSVNPGLCWVSYECSEATVDHQVLLSMLDPHIKSGKLGIFLRTVPIAVEKRGNAIDSVIVYGFQSHNFVRLKGKVFIDATELGEFLPLAGADYVTGAEASSETGEPDAPPKSDPSAAQSFTYAFVLEQSKSGSEAPKPAGYARYAPHFSFRSTDADGKTVSYGMYAQLPNTPGSFWTYRRLIAKEQFKPGTFSSDLSMINWDSNDVCDQGLLSPVADEQAKALQHGKQVSLAFAWWLQHDVPRDDGNGTGYPDLGIVFAALGTTDGLSQFPYVREARRMKALLTIREQDLATAGARAVSFRDSVGIGQYPIDIHACGSSPHLPPSKPYQIPLGALLSANISNLIAASKNIGTTHITNGAYRVHPTEWATGFAAGVVAAAAVSKSVAPKEIDGSPARLRELQRKLIAEGQPLVWFDDVPLDSPYFPSVQFAATLGLIELHEDSLNFSAEEPITGEEAMTALGRLPDLQPTDSLQNVSEIAAQPSLQWSALAKYAHGADQKNGPVKRGEFVQWLVALYRSEPNHK
ncbi:MAG: FAD-dependent oxidoreductase [Candidatus Acidiferrum sp.]